MHGGAQGQTGTTYSSPGAVSGKLATPGGYDCREIEVYRVFEALDELVTIVEEARGVPMTSGCVVPRGDVLELLDDVRDAIPAELDDAQDVLDHRDGVVSKAEAESEKAVTDARTEANRTVSSARAEAEQLLADAREQAEEIVAEARAEAEETVTKGRREYEDYVGRAQSEADRMVQAGRASYEHSVHEGKAEQARLVADTEVVQAAHSEARRIVDEANEDAERLRSECDAYVDSRLADFEDLLSRTLRTVGKGRQQLRSPVGAPFDYEEWTPSGNGNRDH
jgi:cell division septum initiation protein DivIVA